MSERKKLWSGDVPETWKVAPLKHCIAFRSDSLSEGTNPDYWFRYVDIGSVTACSGVTGYAEMAFRDAPSRARKRVRRGDTIVSTVRTYLKAIARIEDDEDVIVSTGFAVLEPCEFDSLYLTFLICSDLVCEEIERRSWGIAYPAISETSMSSIIVPIPPLFEQQLIADHLRRACAKLDSACSVLERQLQTLDDYRKSLIQETVTKGLDLTVDMKPSGYEYLGSIPSTWGMSPLLYLGEMQNGISKDGDSFGSGYPFVSYGDVYRNVFLPRAVEGLVESNSEERYRYSVKKNDAFFTRTSETIDEIGFASVCLESIENATFAGFLIRFRPNTCKLNMRFAAYYFRSENLRAYFAREMVSVTRASLSQNLLGRLVVPLPPLDEQERIANYLDSKYSVVDRLIAGKRKQLETLRAQRQSLIYEYVTGKRRVV
ncbi:restriction endonuclease subunit S [Collinsella tanakaei]|uniref:restriction endonuclease subunit S n=1 Tax=Collinsella tanakaei TaxID=626935 RepID=UPI001F189A41|nr:restriction endonuclease subunit S [Collinsella tanakaei]MCF2621083.1 restriction endonuclease subunit S [Collinsella tanakaei]